jgi:hypothetical protein
MSRGLAQVCPSHVCAIAARDRSTIRQAGDSQNTSACFSYLQYCGFVSFPIKYAKTSFVPIDKIFTYQQNKIVVADRSQNNGWQIRILVPTTTAVVTLSKDRNLLLLDVSVRIRESGQQNYHRVFYLFLLHWKQTKKLPNDMTYKIGYFGIIYLPPKEGEYNIHIAR